MRPFTLVTWLAVTLLANVARAQTAERPTPEPSAPDAVAPEPNPFRLGGYIEANYQWNFNRPSNDITNFRGFDNRHNTFTLSNIALDAQWDHADLIGRVTLQVGHTPSTYYMAEPSGPGASGANATGAELWKYVQQAYAGYRFRLDRELQVAAGVFLSPIGPESMAVRDNWSWSRSNLFFGLPFYHTGARATYSLTDAWSLTIAAYNGWNSVVDNNREKSISAQALYTRAEIVVSILYFGGVERGRGAPEGRGIRHQLDAHVTWNVTPRLSLLTHGNTGVEPTRFGLSHWQAGAVYGRLQVFTPLFVVVRADAFFEHAAANVAGSASSIFWPVSWVSSGTFTVDYRPHERASFRIEYRHDQAAGDMYFGRRVAGDGVEQPYVPNRKSQDSLSLGATTWF
jgi:hypothetical protein